MGEITLFGYTKKFVPLRINVHANNLLCACGYVFRKNYTPIRIGNENPRKHNIEKNK